MFNSACRLLLAFGLLSLVACGQRGPLYLPDNPPPNQGKNLCPTCAPVAQEPAADQAQPVTSDQPATLDQPKKTSDERDANPENQAQQPEASPPQPLETTPDENIE